MSKTKHTPGPWEAKDFCSPPETCYVVDSHGQLLVGAAKKISPANARLIAAAPDMFAVLKALSLIISISPECQDQAWRGTKKDIDTLIDKVEGV